MDTLLWGCDSDYFLRGHVGVRSGLAWGRNYGEKLQDDIAFNSNRIEFNCSFLCRTACKSRWSCSIPFATTNGLRTLRLYCSWTKRICLRRRYARVRWQFAFPNILVSWMWNNIYIFKLVIACFQSDFRWSGVRRGGCLYTGSIWSEKQINLERNLLPHDVRHRYQQHSVCIRCCHRCHHSKQSPRMWTVLSRVSGGGANGNRYGITTNSAGAQQPTSIDQKANDDRTNT